MVEGARFCENDIADHLICDTLDDLVSSILDITHIVKAVKERKEGFSFFQQFFGRLLAHTPPIIYPTCPGTPKQ